MLTKASQPILAGMFLTTRSQNFMAGVDDREQTSQVLCTNAHNTMTTQLRVVRKLIKRPPKDRMTLIT